MKKIINFTLSLFVLSIISFGFYLPLSFAAEDAAFTAGNSLVPCGSDKNPITPGPNGTSTGGEIKNPCGFYDVLKIINKGINFVLFKLVLPIAALLFAYAGIKLIFSGGNSGAKTEAKNIFTSVLIGLAIAAGAWLIVHLLLQILGYNGVSFGL